MFGEDLLPAVANDAPLLGLHDNAADGECPVFRPARLVDEEQVHAGSMQEEGEPVRKGVRSATTGR